MLPAPINNSGCGLLVNHFETSAYQNEAVICLAGNRR
jgi:hypothetical protein